MSVIFKKIPGSEKYRISLNREIIDEYNNLYFQNKGTITINMFGVERTVRKDWLVYVAWFELDTVKNLNNDFENVVFQHTMNSFLKTETGVIAVFKKPLLYNKIYRIVPNYPRYAVSIDGVILDTCTNSIIPPIYRVDSYPDVYIYSPDKTMFKTTKVHRLIALAWISNDDYVTRPIVNHIDGNKNNFKASNLEWVSFAENSQHSVDTGNGSTAIGMKIRDRITKKIYVFASASAMGKFLNKPTIAADAFKYKLPGYLYNKRYEVKTIDDETPWYYENVDDDYVPSKECFSITVENTLDGSINLFNNLLSLKKYIGVGSFETSLDKVIIYARLHHPHLKITYVQNTISGPYTLHNILDNTKQIYSSLKSTSQAIGITKTELQYDLTRKLKYIYGDKYITIPNGETFNIEDYIKKPGVNVNVEATEVVSGTNRLYVTIRGLCSSLKLDKNKVIESIKNNTIYKGYKFRLVY